MVRYAILGSVELRDGQRRVAVGGPRQVALLAALLISANHALSADRLIDALWSDLDEAGAVKRLQVAIARLRRALDPDGVQGESALRTVGGGYLLAVCPGELDAEVFQTRVQEGRRALQAGEAERARDVIGEALGLWRGPVLADVVYEEFAQPEIRRLEELRLSAFEARVDCGLRLGQHDALIGELEALVAAHPGRERLVAQLMLALYRCGRQGDALNAYARARAYLAGELGLEPGPALQALQAEILAQSPALQPVADEPSAGPSPAGQPIMLPIPQALHAPTGGQFVGRDTELEYLRERWTQLHGSEAVAVFVGGEAGIGKTRLAAEFARQAYEEGALVLYGRCDEGLEVPYQPFVQALRPYARAADPSHLSAVLGDLAPELGRLLPELVRLGDPVGGDPRSARLALFEAVAALLEAATRERRALLVLDDLHWATRPTLLLLRHVIRSERPAGVLVLCTYRESELEFGQPLAQLVADLHRDASVQRLSIPGLGKRAIATLLEAAVGHPLDERASTLVDVLATQTGGNPFFLRELLIDVAESAAISSGDERVSLVAMTARLEVPEGLRHVIGQRVARLSAPARHALRAAAVAGATFSFVLLERVLGEDSGVLDAVEEAVAAGLLTETEHRNYGFAHALVRQTIYDQLSAARRMRLHRQLGEALEALDDASAHVEALAHHFTQAAPDGQAVKAADYGLAAGRRASARLGYEEAATHYERALHALAPTGPLQDQRRCELLLALGEARWNAGELDNARQAYEQAAALAKTVRHATALARAALGYCGTYRFEARAALTEPIAELLQQGIAALEEKDNALRARLMGRLADVKHKPVLAAQALEIARRVDDAATLADVLASTLWAASGPDNVHQSRGLAEELLQATDAIGDRRLHALTHGWLLDHLLGLGDIDGVEREREALRQLAETRGERYLTWFSTVFRASHAFLQGQLHDCETLAQDALAHGFKGRDEPAVRAFRMQLLFVRREQGRLDELVKSTEDFVARAAQDRQSMAWRCTLACVHAHVGQTAQARDTLETLSRANFDAVPRDLTWLYNLSALSEVAIALDDIPRARVLYNLLLPYADRCVVVGGSICQGSASRPLGLLATTLSHYEDATRSFGYALTMNARIRSPLWLAHSQQDYARMLLERNQSGDDVKALELLTSALDTAERLDLNALADNARSLMQTAVAAGPSRAPPLNRRI